jgi:hypothetical protein
MGKVEETAKKLRAAEVDFARRLARIKMHKAPDDVLSDPEWEDVRVFAEDFASEVLVPFEDALLAHHNAVEAAKAQAGSGLPLKEGEPYSVWREVERAFIDDVCRKCGRQFDEKNPAADLFRDGIRAAFRNIRLAKALPE